MIETRNNEILEQAIKRNLPTSIANISFIKDKHALMFFSCDLYLSGKQTAQQADQILKGIRPADLPVKMAEAYLAINLEIARTIGLIIPDEILHQTHVIIH